MKVKTYKTNSLEEGLENIKRDLGADALILGTRSVSSRPAFGLFKRQGWEITAEVEEKTAVGQDLRPSPAASRHPLPMGEGMTSKAPLPLGEGGAKRRVRVASSTGTGVELAPLPAVETPRVI